MKGTARVADCHNDLLLAVRHLREREHNDPFGDFWLPQLREGGVALQVLPICIEEQFVGEAALRRCLLMVEEAHHLAAAHRNEVALVTSTAALDDALAAGKIALVLAVEGCEPVGSDLAILSTLYRLGIRMVSFTWNRRTMLADGVGEHDTGGGLTRLGVQAVSEIERIGSVLDVSHLSEAGFWHVAELATSPLVASHSSCRALQDHPRNLTDSQIKAIAATGGFVGLNAFGPFLGDDPRVETYLDHVEHAVALVGAGHVVLGPDFIADVASIVDPIFAGILVDPDRLPAVPGLRGPADLCELPALLVDRLGSERAEQVLFGTLHHFLRRLLQAPELPASPIL